MGSFNREARVTPQGAAIGGYGVGGARRAMGVRAGQEVAE